MQDNSELIEMQFFSGNYQVKWFKTLRNSVKKEILENRSNEVLSGFYGLFPDYLN